MCCVVLACYAGCMTVSADDPRPPRNQVADILRDEIARGIHPAGKRLPSVRNLAKRFDVSANTAQAAIDLLRQEFLVYSAGNRGTFVGSGDAMDAADTDLSERVTELEKQLQELAGRVAVLERTDASHAVNDA